MYNVYYMFRPIIYFPNNPVTLVTYKRRMRSHHLYDNCACLVPNIGFGGLGVACWPLVPKFAGSNPAEAVGFLRAKKNPQHAFLRRGSKAVGPMS